jgi:hypothetical protein
LSLSRIDHRASRARPPRRARARAAPRAAAAVRGGIGQRQRA